jgi:hypothetical protein
MDINSIGSTVLMVGIILIVCLFFITLTGLATWLFFRWKRYSEFNCIIFEKDGLGNLRSYLDKAGIFIDRKTNNKRFFMKKAKVGLTPDNIPYVYEGSKKTVYMYRYGLMNFKFIRLNITQDKVSIGVGEEDVNWAINAYDRQKKLFSQSLLLQILPYAALVIVAMVILIIFIYFFKDFGVLRDVAIALKEAAVALGQAAGTTVVTG